MDSFYYYCCNRRLSLQILLPAPAEIKRRDANFHLCTSRLLKPSRRSGDFFTPASQHWAKAAAQSDSVVKGVLVAMDYDVDKLNDLYPKTK